MRISAAFGTTSTKPSSIFAEVFGERPLAPIASCDNRHMYIGGEIQLAEFHNDARASGISALVRRFYSIGNGVSQPAVRSIPPIIRELPLARGFLLLRLRGALLPVGRG